MPPVSRTAGPGNLDLSTRSLIISLRLQVTAGVKRTVSLREIITSTRLGAVCGENIRAYRRLAEDMDPGAADVVRRDGTSAE